MVGIPFNAATAAYGNAQKLINQAAKPQADLTAMTGSSGGDSAFGQMLAQSVQDVVAQGNASELNAGSMSFTPQCLERLSVEVLSICAACLLCAVCPAAVSALWSVCCAG